MSSDYEHTETLRTQVAELIDILMAMLTSDDIATCDPATVAQGLERYMQQVEQIAATASTSEWLGLYNICVLYQGALIPIISNPNALSVDALMLLESWPALVMGYLDAPGSPDASAMLIEHLQDPAWAAPLPADEAEILQEILVAQAPSPAPPAEAATAEDPELSHDLGDDDAFSEEAAFEEDAFSDDVFDAESPAVEGIFEAPIASDDAFDAVEPNAQDMLEDNAWSANLFDAATSSAEDVFAEESRSDDILETAEPHETEEFEAHAFSDAVPDLEAPPLETAFEERVWSDSASDDAESSIRESCQSQDESLSDPAFDTEAPREFEALEASANAALSDDAFDSTNASEQEIIEEEVSSDVVFDAEAFSDDMAFEGHDVDDDAFDIVETVAEPATESDTAEYAYSNDAFDPTAPGEEATGEDQIWTDHAFAPDATGAPSAPDACEDNTLSEALFDTAEPSEAAAFEEEMSSDGALDTETSSEQGAFDADDTLADPDAFALAHDAGAAAGVEPSQAALEAVDAVFDGDDADALLTSEFQDVEPEALGELETFDVINDEVTISTDHDEQASQLDAATKELVLLLSFEVNQFAESLETLPTAEADEDWRQILTDHLEDIERLGDGAEAAGPGRITAGLRVHRSQCAECCHSGRTAYRRSAAGHCRLAPGRFGLSGKSLCTQRPQRHRRVFARWSLVEPYFR